MSIIDDLSRKVWVFILKSKDETFMKFKEWLMEMENQTNKKLKVIRTDNRLEFLTSEFNIFCAEKGILRHKSFPGNPQHSEVVERINRTILERERCMFLGVRL